MILQDLVNLLKTPFIFRNQIFILTNIINSTTTNEHEIIQLNDLPSYEEVTDESSLPTYSEYLENEFIRDNNNAIENFNERAFSINLRYFMLYLGIMLVYVFVFASTFTLIMPLYPGKYGKTIILFYLLIFTLVMTCFFIICTFIM